MAKDTRPSTPVPEIDPDTAGTEKTFPPPDPKSFLSGRTTGNVDYMPLSGPGQDPEIEEGTEKSPRDPENPERPLGEPEEWKRSVGPSASDSTSSTVAPMQSTSGYTDRQDFRRQR
jgi:hypothetical protein